MNNLTRSTYALAVIMTVLLTAGGIACAAEKIPMTPEYAAKHENVRKQKDQRITNDQRKLAAERLKAERIKVYNAKQAAKGAAPSKTNETK